MLRKSQKKKKKQYRAKKLIKQILVMFQLLHVTANILAIITDKTPHSKVSFGRF